MRFQAATVWCWLLAAVIATAQGLTVASPIAVRNREGTSHGFVVVRSDEGKILATGDAIQTVKGSRVTSELMLHFVDGSLHQETTVFEQGTVFRLLSDHLIQQGPAFGNQTDALIDMSGKVTLRSKGGKEKSYQLRMPDDTANGLLLTIIKNLPTADSETSVSLVITSSKPRVVKFRIRPSGTQPFSAGGAPHKALHLVGHVDIGGVAGALATVVGKQPPDVDFWIVAGKAPAFVKFRGPLCEQGSSWNIELVSPKLEDQPKASTQ
jgi:hypothetical protein